jgi:hypothetical protein
MGTVAARLAGTAIVRAETSGAGLGCRTKENPAVSPMFVVRRGHSLVRQDATRGDNELLVVIGYFDARPSE